MQEEFNAQWNDARAVDLADQVGLGKTVQLAVAALLMALDGSGGRADSRARSQAVAPAMAGRINGAAPAAFRPLDCRAWVDENDREYPSEGVKSLGKCPRRLGLVSQGLVVRGLSEAVHLLLSRSYTCVIADKAHRARRRKLPSTTNNRPPQLIDRTTITRNPFNIKYSKVEDADWETCSYVLNSGSVKELLSRGW